MGRNKTPSAAETKAITDKFDSETTKLLADYEKINKDGIDDVKNNGVPFKNAADAIGSTVKSFIPQPQSCTPYVMSLGDFGNITLECELFDMWKLLFGWFLSVATAIYIYHLSVRPVQR